MVGTPKQIKWAEEIKATYLEKMDEAKRYLERIAETGKDDDVYPTGAMIFVECYHNDALYDNVRKEMKDSDLYRKIRSVPKGTPEKREAISAFRKAVGRVNGANFGSIYGKTKAMGYKQISLPSGHTWKSYTIYLLNTLPPDLREHYIKIFRTSVEFWKTTGGGFSDEVISDIREHGYKIKENGVSNFSKDQKTRIILDQEMPDDTDDVTSTQECATAS